VQNVWWYCLSPPGHLEVDDWITGGEGNSLVDGHVVQDSKETNREDADKKVSRCESGILNSVLETGNEKI